MVGILQLLKERYPNYFEWSSSWKIAIVFLLFSIFQSWQVEYKSRLGREGDLVNSNHALDLARNDVQTLRTQNGAQQGTINGLLTPEPQRITPVFLDYQDTAAGRQTRWLVLVNKTLTPVDLVVRCTTDLESVNIIMPGAAVITGGGDRLTRTEWQYRITSPAWSPTSPLLATVSSTVKQPNTVCSFNLR